MRTSLLASLALAGAILLVSFCAQAAPVHVRITAAAGNQSWKSPPIFDPSYVNLSAWQWDGTQWAPAWMTNATDALGNPGLGVCGFEPNANKACEDASETNANASETNAIDTIPAQLIDLNISQFEHWNGLTITLLAFDQPNWPGLFGAHCNPSNPGCEPDLLQGADCEDGGHNTYACTLTREYLEDLGVSDIWIAPYNIYDPSSSGSNSSFLLGAGLDQGLILDLNHQTVPEPSALGMFGLGALLLGLFACLRRRQLR